MPDAGNYPNRICVVATDTLRVAGLQEMMGHDVHIEHVAVAEAMESDCGLVMTDDAAEKHLLARIESFKKAKPDTRIIVLSGKTDEDLIRQVISSGAKGYLSYRASAGEVQMCLGVVADGSVWAPRKVLSRLLDDSRNAPPPVAESKFTPREREVLTLLSEGRSNKEIGDALSIDITTVKAHVSRLMRKVGVQNRVALTLKTLDQG